MQNIYGRLRDILLKDVNNYIKKCPAKKTYFLLILGPYEIFKGRTA
jgi:hypothetical protein